MYFVILFIKQDHVRSDYLISEAGKHIPTTVAVGAHERVHRSGGRGPGAITSGRKNCDFVFVVARFSLLSIL
jgi:hypothetical protein